MQGNLVFYERFSKELLKHGVMRPIDPSEPWFVSCSHTNEDIDETLNKIEDALRSVPYKESKD